jgi:hypothetical protein
VFTWLTERLDKTSATLAAVAVVLSFASGAMWGLWRFGDYVELRPVLKREWREQIEAQLKSLDDRSQKAHDDALFVTYQSLKRDWSRHQLSKEDKQQMCNLSWVLNLELPEGVRC